MIFVVEEEKEVLSEERRGVRMELRDCYLSDVKEKIGLCKRPAEVKLIPGAYDYTIF